MDTARAVRLESPYGGRSIRYTPTLCLDAMHLLRPTVPKVRRLSTDHCRRTLRASISVPALPTFSALRANWPWWNTPGIASMDTARRRTKVIGAGRISGGAALREVRTATKAAWSKGSAGLGSLDTVRVGVGRRVGTCFFVGSLNEPCPRFPLNN